MQIGAVHLGLDSNWWGIGMVAWMLLMLSCVWLVDRYGEAIYDWCAVKLGERADPKEHYDVD